jgi:hypothetical protein
MVTRFWYKAVKTYFSTQSMPNGETVKDSSGTDRQISYADSSTISVLFPARTPSYYTGTNVAYFGIVLGTGTTPATVDDYWLEHIIKSGLNVQITNMSQHGIYRLILTITNESDSSITIGEIGAQVPAVCVGASKRAFMMDRTVLDTPVTIPSGGIGKIEYEIKINLPIDEA